MCGELLIFPESAIRHTQVNAGRMGGHGPGLADCGLLAPPIANLKAASPLALDDDVAVPRAQFDLAKLTGTGLLRFFRVVL